MGQWPASSLLQQSIPVVLETVKIHAWETVSRELYKMEKDSLIILHKRGIEFDIIELEKRLDSII